MQWIDDALHDTRHGWRSLRRSPGFAARTREIGMRMALGAERRNVMRLRLSQSTLLTVLGAAFGLAGSAAVTRYLQGHAVRVDAARSGDLRDCAACARGDCGGLASSVPVRRATRIDPLVALHHE
jgi:putative ABC transport system permease protein